MTTALLQLAAGATGQPQGRTFWMPPEASDFAGRVDFVFFYIYTLALIFFVIIVGVMVLFAWRYRRRPGVRSELTSGHNTPLELAWSIIPGILLVPMFWWGFREYLNMRTAPADALDIQVRAYQWAWEFSYPNGAQSDTLHVPLGRPVRLTLQSDDVIHSLFVPAFRTKMDVVPGRYNTMWFRATRAGTFPLYCAEYCGTKHSDMRSACVVHPSEEYSAVLAGLDPLKKLTEEQYLEYQKDPAAFVAAHPELKLETPAQLGRKLYERKGCKQCHTLDGTVLIGPSWKGLWGRQEALVDGSSVTVEENYVRESILDPQKRIVAGFAGKYMQPYQGRITDREITMIIEFMKTLKE